MGNITVMLYMICHKCHREFHGELKEYHWVEYPDECPECRQPLQFELRRKDPTAPPEVKIVEGGKNE